MVRWSTAEAGLGDHPDHPRHTARAHAPGPSRGDRRGRSPGTVALPAAHASPTASYGVRITTQDAAGNRRTVVLRLVVDRTAGWLRWKPARVLPAGPRRAGPSRDGVLPARPPSDHHAPGRRRRRGCQIRTAWHGRTPDAGTAAGPGTAGTAGALVAPGGYTLVLTASGRYGTTVLRQAIVVDAFAVSLSATRLRAGQRLTVTFRSVEPLAGRPAVTFDQTGLRPVRRRRPARAGALDRHASGSRGAARAGVDPRQRDRCRRPANASLRSVSVR